MVPGGFGGLDGGQHLRLNLGKTSWLWVHGAPGSGTLSSSILDGVALPQRDPVCHLGVLLDARLLRDSWRAGGSGS